MKAPLCGRSGSSTSVALLFHISLARGLRYLVFYVRQSPPTSKKMPRLIVTTESGGKAIHEMNEDLITLGRASDNMIQIEDQSVSGRHAQLLRSGEAYRLKDLNSTNGTRVNGEAIAEVTLRIGDRIWFGKVEARFAADASGATLPLPEIAPIEAKLAEASASPADFANASPFPNRKDAKDPTRVLVLAAAAMALLTFPGSMIAVLLMRPPL